MKVVRRDDDGGAALDEMADDMGVLSEGGGALDYEVYYPTMLPLLPPEQERASMLAAGSAPATTAQEVRRWREPLFWLGSGAPPVQLAMCGPA